MIVMFRASIDDFRGYEHYAYAATEAEAVEELASYILTETIVSIATVQDVVEFFGVRTEPVLPGVYCESDPSRRIDPAP